MRIACLQFSPQVGQVRDNIARADELLRGYSAGDIDLLVLPEMAFSGYSFASLKAITPFLEPTAAGPTAQWAKATAARLRCVVSVGYPEIAIRASFSPTTTMTTHSPLSPSAPSLSPPASSPPSLFPSSSNSSPRYNSTITVSPDGDILAHYRKTHLYYTDETWAQESPTGWLTVPLVLPFPSPSSFPTTSPNHSVSTPTRTTFGICMDINPHQFTAPWTRYELATHALTSSTQLLLLSMAWLTTLPSTALHGALAQEPDHETLRYWCARLEPLVLRQTRCESMMEVAAAVEEKKKEKEKEEKEKKAEKVVVVFANRCGEEGPEARYAGTSWVGTLGDGEMRVWDIAGRGEERVLLVDTEEERGGSERGGRWRFG